MALSATPAPVMRARAPRSMFSDARTGRKLVTAFLLARMSLLVLSGRAWVNVACLDHDEDGVDHRCTAGSRLEVLLVGSTELGTASARSTNHPVRRAPDRAAAQTVLPQQDRAVGGRIGSRAAPVQAEEGGVLGARRAGSASAIQATTTSLVVAGLIGLLGVGGAAAFLVHTITGPVRRAVRVVHAPVEGRVDQRLQPTMDDELPDMSEQATDVRAVAANPAEIAPDVAETTSVLPEIARVVREARLQALEAAIRREEPAPEAAESTITAPSTPTARPVPTTRYAAARGRALGPTTALWHAVQLDRLVGVVGGACETTVCGSLVRLTTEEAWPVAARDVCPACATLAH